MATFSFTLREPKMNFELPNGKLGREPAPPGKQGHYGLGLHRARGILEAHGGKLGRAMP